MKKATLLVIIICILFACNSEKKTSFLNTENIKTQLYKIDPLKGNTIKGARGGIFTIPAGAFEGTEPVVIELKEIYSPIEILASGLTTESNGELLESGGMFYINAKRDGKQLELLKPIEGSIPSNYINDSMKLFKGEVKEDGNVNWVEPEKLINDTAKKLACIDDGKILFQQNCASCHAVFKKLTGPAMAGADRRITRQMYYDIVANPAKAGKKYPYFDNQIKSYYGILMTAFPQLEKTAIDCIIEYIKAAEKNPELYDPSPAVTAPLDSVITDTTFMPDAPCGFDTTYVNEEFEAVVANAIERLNNTPDTIDLDTLPKVTDTIPDVTIAENYKERYEFKISTLGWYNIDILMKELEGTIDVTISATTNFEDIQAIDVRIYMPEKKISLDGKLDNEDKTFYFGNNKNKIPMFIGDKAIVFAIADSKGELYYSVQELNTQMNMKIELVFKQTTQSELDEAFKKINLDNINLDRQTKKPVVVPIPCDLPEKSPPTAQK